MGTFAYFFSFFYVGSVFVFCLGCGFWLIKQFYQVNQNQTPLTQEILDEISVEIDPASMTCEITIIECNDSVG